MLSKFLKSMEELKLTCNFLNLSLFLYIAITLAIFISSGKTPLCIDKLKI